MCLRIIIHIIIIVAVDIIILSIYYFAVAHYVWKSAIYVTVNHLQELRLQCFTHQ